MMLTKRAAAELYMRADSAMETLKEVQRMGIEAGREIDRFRFTVQRLKELIRELPKE